MLTRPVTTFVLPVVIVVGCASAAVAGDEWGAADCSQNPLPGCELGAGTNGRDSAPHHESRGSDSDGETGGSGDSRGESAVPKSRNPDLNLADCSYQRSDYEPPPTTVQTTYVGPSGGLVGAQAAVYIPSPSIAVVPAAEPKPGEPGAWYVYKCTAGGVRDALYRPPIWIPDGQAAGVAVPHPSPIQLAQTARNQLRLPSPQIETNPTGEQLVGLPTWLWLERGEWTSVSATASVPGVSVTAVARPETVDWVMGDGSTVTCAGPGVPYKSAGTAATSADPQSASPDCGHTYRTSSAGRSGSVFPVTAMVRWTVTWSGAGENGVFPGLTTTSSAAFRVAESQALNDDG